MPSELPSTLPVPALARDCELNVVALFAALGLALSLTIIVRFDTAAFDVIDRVLTLEAGICASETPI